MKGVYQIRNIVNNKTYIGSSVYIKKRWWTHKMFLNKQNHCNPHLQNAWNKYGKGSFMCLVIEDMPDATLEEVQKAEQWYLDNTKQDYNINPNATGGSAAGRKLSEEHKANISKANIGKKVSEEMKARLRIFQTGVKQSEETKMKRRKSLWGKNSKLTERQVVLARFLYGACGVAQKEIAYRFGVSKPCINSAITGRNWKHI